MEMVSEAVNPVTVSVATTVALPVLAPTRVPTFDAVMNFEVVPGKRNARTAWRPEIGIAPAASGHVRLGRALRLIPGPRRCC